MKTLLIFTLIFTFATPNQAQTRRTARATSTPAAAFSQPEKKQNKRSPTAAKSQVQSPKAKVQRAPAVRLPLYP